MTTFNDRIVIYASKNNDIDMSSPILEFNGPGNGMSRWWCDEIDGWKNTASLDFALSTFGTSDGAWPANRGPAKEKYITVQGACTSASRAISEDNWDQLVNSFPPGKDFYIVRYEPVPKIAKVRLFDVIEMPQQFEQEFRFAIPLVIPSGVKQSLNKFEDFVNTFAGGLVYRSYTGQVDGDTNWAINSSFEVDVTTGTFLLNGATATRSNTAPIGAGSWHARVVTSATTNSGIAIKTYPVTPNGWDPVIWNGSLSLRGNAGGEAIDTWLRFFYTDGTISDTTHFSRTLTTVYQTFTHTGEPDDSKDVDYMEVHARAPGTTAGVVFFVDRVHINAGPAPTPYLNGGGTTSAFFIGTANISPSSSQAFPKSPGKRSWTNYTRTWTQGTLAGEGVVEQALVNNAGTATSYPVTTVTGPLYEGGWEIRNDTTGERLTFRVDIPEGSSLVIDHENQTAVMNGQHLEYRKDGTWWGLVNGVNQLRLAADDYTDAATATFSHRDAWRN